MPGNRNLQDAALTVAVALPASAGTVVTPAINLSTGPFSDFVAECDYVLPIPALSTAQLPNSATVTYTVQLAAPSDSGFGSPATVQTYTQTGAGGAGAAAQTPRFRLPSTAQGFLRAQAVTANSPGNCSGAELSLYPVF